jgi:hypothetical protein
LGPTELRAEWVGAALIVRRADPHPWTVGVAQVLPPEPGRTLVVVDAGAIAATIRRARTRRRRGARQVRVNAVALGVITTPRHGPS